MHTITTNLTHLAVIRASGSEAASFLQGQLSNDFVLLPLNQWQLAAYCSPKGRMLASFWGIKLAEDEILLVLSTDILAPTLKRLQMFVMRAKVMLSDATERLSDLAAHHGLAAWSEGEVQRGIPRITAPIVDLFVPQMLNYESVGGVSFKKGCYPGQEVVARSQFRGTIKRRTYVVLYSSEIPPEIGSPVFETGADDSVGTVVQVDKDKALICIQTSSSLSALHTSTGTELIMSTLPYELLNTQ